MSASRYVHLKYRREGGNAVRLCATFSGNIDEQAVKHVSDSLRSLEV